MNLLPINLYMEVLKYHNRFKPISSNDFIEHWRNFIEVKIDINRAYPNVRGEFFDKEELKGMWRVIYE